VDPNGAKGKRLGVGLVVALRTTTHLFRNYEKVLIRDSYGKLGVDSVLLDPPEFKVNNIFTRERICASYDDSDDLNVGVAILRHAELHDHIGINRTKEQWANTPLIRDPRSSKVGEPGGAFLKPSVILEIHRMMILQLPALFADKGMAPSHFGNHSWRIGGMNSLCLLNCPKLLLMSMGRWVSESMLNYLRENKARVLAWERRMGRPAPL
jgi:hypothetical protein